MSAVPPTPPTFEEILNTHPDKLPRNKQTEAVHKRETWQQIYFPLIAGGVCVAVCVVAVVAASGSNGAATTVWMNVSLVFLIAQFMVILFPLLLLFLAAWGIGKLIHRLPPYLKIAQDYTELAARKTEWAMRYVVEPVLQIRSAVAGLDKFIQTVMKFMGRFGVGK